MSGLSFLYPYFPIITALIGGYIAYVFAIKKTKNEQFENNLEDSIKQICSPIYHELLEIMRIEEPFKREEKISTFFKKYSSIDTNIYKIADQRILNNFYDAERLFYEFNKNRTESNWDNFWTKFHSFNDSISNAYFDNCSILYRNFDWQKKKASKGFFYRVLNELFIFLYDFNKLLIIISLLLASLIITDKIEGQNLIPNTYTKLFIIIFILILLPVHYLLYMLTSNFSLSIKRQSRKSTFENAIEGLFPKLYKKWDSIGRVKPSDLKKQGKIPKMYIPNEDDRKKNKIL